MALSLAKRPRPPTGEKILPDTNIFIDFLKTGAHAHWVAGSVVGKFRYLSVIVQLELHLGRFTAHARREVDRLCAAFGADRVVVPTASSYRKAASIFQKIHGHADAAMDRLGPMNDILIALTAWQIGAILITQDNDFVTIAKHLPGLQWRKPDQLR